MYKMTMKYYKMLLVPKQMYYRKISKLSLYLEYSFSNVQNDDEILENVVSPETDVLS